MASTSWCGKHPSVSPFAGVFCPACFPYLHQSKESVVSNDQSIEQEIQAKGLTAPRITPDDIEANIADERFFTAWEGAQLAYWGDSDPDNPKTEEGQPDKNGPLSLLTFCVLVLRNGFTVTGESACASPENFDAELGRKIARQNAVSKMWPLMGYALKEKLHNEVA